MRVSNAWRTTENSTELHSRPAKNAISISTMTYTNFQLNLNPTLFQLLKKPMKSIICKNKLFLLKYKTESSL